jgi:hypothetical protein
MPDSQRIRYWWKRHWLTVVVCLAIAALVVVFFAPFIQQSVKVFQSDLNGRPISWPVLVSSLLGSLATLLFPFIFIVLLAVVVDTVYYYIQYRRPYLLALLGRKFPIDVKKTQRDVSKQVVLYNAVSKAIDEAQVLSRSPSAWGSSEAFTNAFWQFVANQLGLIGEAFNRAEGKDDTRAFLMLVEDGPKGQSLSFLPSPFFEGAKDSLSVAHSVAGRAVRQTVGDAIGIANVANVYYDPDFVIANNDFKTYRSLLCVPIVCYDEATSSTQPMFVLSVDSTIDEAFSPEYVDAARAIGSCIGIVAQRLIDYAWQELSTKDKKQENEPSGPVPPEQA